MNPGGRRTAVLNLNIWKVQNLTKCVKCDKLLLSFNRLEKERSDEEDEHGQNSYWKVNEKPSQKLG